MTYIEQRMTVSSIKSLTRLTAIGPTSRVSLQMSRVSPPMSRLSPLGSGHLTRLRQLIADRLPQPGIRPSPPPRKKKITKTSTTGQGKNTANFATQKRGVPLTQATSQSILRSWKMSLAASFHSPYESRLSRT